MAETFIVNASPLILFAKIRQLHLFPLLARHLLVPRAVVGEVSVGSGGAQAIEQILAFENVQVAAAAEVPDSIGRWDLGDGESQVLAAALGRPEAILVLDDLAARKCARTHGFALIGSAGLIGLLKKRQFIPLAMPLLMALTRAGLRISPEVLQAVLEEVGENPMSMVEPAASLDPQ